ncbi:MAG: hypothetical protein ACLRPR_06555 [Eisenbergiella sp.]
MNASCDTSDIQTKNKKRVWQTVLVVALAVCALPVLVPLIICLGAGGLGILVAVGAGIAALAVAAGSCVLGLVVAGGACIAGAVICMAAMFFGGAAGIGVGIVAMFRTPASGLAIFGASLIRFRRRFEPLVTSTLIICFEKSSGVGERKGGCQKGAQGGEKSDFL